jgi:hypothetical protein
LTLKIKSFEKLKNAVPFSEISSVCLKKAISKNLLKISKLIQQAAFLKQRLAFFKQVVCFFSASCLSSLPQWQSVISSNTLNER